MTDQDQTTQQSEAVATGNAYDLIKKRLTEQGNTLSAQIQGLNDARLAEFGNTQMQVLARTRIRTDNNCIARDMVQVGNYLLFGYNVHMGLKQETHISDVLSLYQLVKPQTDNLTDSESDSESENEYTLEPIPLTGTFLDQANFIQDFNELYRYYKKTKLSQLLIKDGKLLIAFQIGESITDIRVFRFALTFNKQSFNTQSAHGIDITYMDNRGERDIALPPEYDFDWLATTREHIVNGKFPHINILDTLFVETMNGDLTIKIENNTDTGQGIFSEPVQDKSQSINDAQIFYAKVGSLILLKILPYRETDFRFLVYNTLTESVIRLDAIGQSCVQLLENHGIVFPNGYYLQTGDYKLFDEQKHQSANLKFLKKIISPNGEDVLFLFYDIFAGVTGLFAYNLIKKQLQNPIFCHGMALANDGTLVLFTSDDEPTRIHPMQIWQTPFVSEEFVQNQVESTSFYGKIGNKELVRGISDLYSIIRLINNQSVSQKLYEELSKNASKLFDTYYWLNEPILKDIAHTIKDVIATSELVIDEFAKVQSIQKQTQKAVTDAESKQTEIFRQIRITTFETADDFVKQLNALRQQKGHLASLENLRYLDVAKLDNLKSQIDTQERELAEQTVNFLSGEKALASYENVLTDINAQLDKATTNAELSPILQTIDDTAHGLDLLTELLGSLDVADATIRTQIIDEIGTIYSRLNQSKANLNHKRKNFGSVEAIAQFGASFKLFSQSINNALSIATTPEKADEQLARLLMKLEELESQFSDPNNFVGDEFLADIIAKREEIYETFETHKQSLLDARNRKAQTLTDGALRMLESIKKRTQSTGAIGFNDEDTLNTYFASDNLVEKVRAIAKELQTLGFSVKSDDIDARLKAIQVESFKNLKDKSDLFEAGGNVIKLGKHRFSVNTQPLDLTLLTRDTDSGKQLNLHLTGTDFYQEIHEPRLNDLKAFWDMNLASETASVYRGEFLAYSMIQSAKQGQDGLTTEKLYYAFDNSQHLPNPANDSQLLDLVKSYITPRYQLGYEKGIHDHDATLILLQILPLLKTADLLTFEPSVRALAQIFMYQINLQKKQEIGENWFTINQSAISHWQDRAIIAYQLQQALNSDTAKNLLVADIQTVLTRFVAEKLNGLFDLSHIALASDYLAQALGKAENETAILTWQTSQQADNLYQKLQTTVGLERFNYLQSVLAKLTFEPKSAFELATTWLNALLENLQHQDEENQQNWSHYIAETSAMLIIRSDDKTENFNRQISPISLEISVNGLLGEHSKIHNQTLNFSLDSFLSQMYQHQSVTMPNFDSYKQLRSQILHTAKDELRLSEFVARPLSSFVRNRLIDNVYLPLIGDNLAKQMGTVGDNKRTDLMGLLMMISPPGYGKTTLMEYVANRLGLIFMKINCPSLGHDVTSLDPAKAPNATAQNELEKLNLALEMGNNVMLYLDDIQHTNPEFLQKFISLCDGTRRIDGVWQGQTKTYDMRGKKFCVVMAGNPYTESGEVFKVPDMLANRADIYNLGDILGGTADIFALSYIENALTSNSVLAPLANRDMADVYALIDKAKGIANTHELSYNYSLTEINEIVAILQKMFAIQDVILQVNQAYIASAGQDDNYRTEPAFKLQGSYRNMNKMTEKLSSVMNQAELNQLIDDHYLGEAQLLTKGTESNLLKLAELRNVMTTEQAERWQQIKADFMRNKAMGGDSNDTGNRIVAQLVDMVNGFGAINKTLHQQAEKWADTQQNYAQNNAISQHKTEELFVKLSENWQQNFANQQDSFIKSQQQFGSQIHDKLNENLDKNLANFQQIYQNQQALAKLQQQNQQVLLTEILTHLSNAIESLQQNSASNPQNKEQNLVNTANTQAEQNQQLVNALKQVLEPFIMRFDEKLRLDMSTDESGKLLVSNLRKLTQIFGD